MIGLLSLLVSLAAASPQQDYEAGVAASRSGQHAEAVAHFLQALEGGARDPVVYHGLGNSLYRQGKLGPAVAAWRRGIRLAPHDGDIAANLDRGRRESRDRLDPPAPAYGPFFWQAALSPRGSATLASLCATFALTVPLLAAIARLRPEPGRLQRLAESLRGAAFAAATAAILLICSTLVALRQSPGAVVVVPQVAVRSALGPDGVDLFVLHEGAEVRVLEQSDAAVLVALPDERKGWLSADAVLSTDPAAPFPLPVL